MEPTRNDDQSELSRHSERFGEVFGLRWSEVSPRRKGTGYMLWEDEESCLYVDAFGELAVSEKSVIASAALDTHSTLNLPCSFRIGFHRSEKEARATMDAWFGFDPPDENGPGNAS